MVKKKSPKVDIKTVQIQIHELKNCPGCGVAPGLIHLCGCLAEHCSHCGYPRKGCKSEEHDPEFSRWTGIYPGVAECYALGLVKDDGSPDIIAFLSKGLTKVFHVKPKIILNEPENVPVKTIISTPEGEVWLTSSDMNDEDVVVHGAFTSKEYADRCAKDVQKAYPKRRVLTAAWKINEAWIDLSDGHLRFDYSVMNKNNRREKST
jgi:hypothetical protein